MNFFSYSHLQVKRYLGHQDIRVWKAVSKVLKVYIVQFLVYKRFISPYTSKNGILIVKKTVLYLRNIFYTCSKWTGNGCKLIQNGHKRTACQCNHLTNFAILMRPYSPVLFLLFVQLMHFLLLKEIFRFVSMLGFVEGRGQTSPKDNVFDWSHSFYHFHSANLYNIHFDLEVSQIYRITCTCIYS